MAVFQETKILGLHKIVSNKVLLLYHFMPTNIYGIRDVVVKEKKISQNICISSFECVTRDKKE